MATRRKASGEDRLIERYFRPIAKNPAALGLLDDAAMLAAPADADLVVTADAIVAGIHFFPGDPADMVAKKALRVNLSDLAAKGAAPLAALLTIALPKGTGDRWLEKFAHGLGTDCAQFHCPLIGGDTVATKGPVAISITALGEVPQGRMVHRSGAKAGDAVMVTGTIGDAALGLLARRNPRRAAFRRLDRKARAHLERRYLLPQPRLALVNAIREFATAAIDVSDGLVGDLAKLAAVSGLGAGIATASGPLSPSGGVGGARSRSGARPDADDSYRRRRLRSPAHGARGAPRGVRGGCCRRRNSRRGARPHAGGRRRGSLGRRRQTAQARAPVIQPLLDGEGGIGK